LTPRRRFELLLFSAVLAAYAWFHQGGGWSQNARFAMVRAIVEAGTVSVDPYLIYRPGDAPGRLRPAPVAQGTFEEGGHRVALAWERGLRVTGEPEADPQSISVWGIGATGDLVYARGRLHPNKAPGTAFLAVPAYAAVRMLGIGLDTPRGLAIAAWLTGVLSVGLLAALATVLFHRIALEYASGNEGAALLATVAFAFGTMYFPYATMLYEHDVVAACLVIAFYAIRRARVSSPAWGTVAGAAAGWGAITNYVTAAVVAILAAYLVMTVRRRAAWAAYAAGVLGPFLLICVYNVACFGTPFTTNYAAQNPMFLTAGNWLGVFVPPSASVLLTVTISPFRGLFLTSPVLLPAIFGLVRMLRGRRHGADAWTCVAIAGFYLLFTISFNAWQGGNGVGPRYLVPALPFLALALPFAIERMPKITASLAAASIALQFLVTAVDPQVPVVDVPGRALWKASPLTDYLLPLWLSGRAGPLVEAVIDGTVERQGAEDRELIRERALRLPVALVRGPVSVNPIGMYEGWYYTQFAAGSPEANVNSFNVGEALFPRSRLSLVPLLVLEAALFALISARYTPRRR
jgi:hypothetical protein